MVDCPSAYVSRLSKCLRQFDKCNIEILNELCFQFKVSECSALWELAMALLIKQGIQEHHWEEGLS